MARFVILEHDHPYLHWDLMLECGDVLKTWRLLEPPRQGGVIAAEASFDHRLHYLEYEGPVSGNRGNVKKWDFGLYEGTISVCGEQAKVMSLVFAGNRVNGNATLENLEGVKWTLVFV